jgi:alpha-glucosidase
MATGGYAGGMTADAPWWTTGVVYQIYPRSFADGNGDGVGDLAGIRARIPYLQWLGIDAIWLSPVYRSPMADFGYDISDHCDIDPVFGDLDEMDGLIADCHGAGIRLMLDWVPNHTSNEHPWFLESRSSRDASKRSWYVWRDGTGRGAERQPPNNWRAAFGGRAWTWDDRTGQWYLHLFLPQQPDLNWANPEVEQAQHDVLRFWLDRGIDGFRADVVHLIGKGAELPDVPDGPPGTSIVGTHDHPSTHVLLRRIRALLDAYPGKRAMVGEVNLRGAARIAPYYGEGDELHLVFDFELLRQPWSPRAFAACAIASEDALGPRNAWPVNVLSNHDQPRHRTRFGGSEARARVAALLLLTLRGTPFLFAGEELGAQDALITESTRVDPGGRDGCRSPIAWSADEGHGWPEHTWLPFEPNADRANVETLEKEPSSILCLYRALLAARRSSPALHLGSWELQRVDDAIYAYDRRHGDDVRRVIANFSDEAVTLAPDGEWIVEIDTSAREPGAPWTGTLPPESAVLLRPAP